MVLNSSRIGLPLQRSPILFLCLPRILVLVIVIQSCTSQQQGHDSIEILWEHERAYGVVVPSKYLSGVPPDSIPALLHVYLSGSADRASILGEYSVGHDGIIFRPLVPFTPGLSYEVAVAGETIGKIQIPKPDNNHFAEVTGILPSQDTLPENLLKIYISFSHSMREGQALKYVTLLKGADTAYGSFLDLQPELWNKDYTTLTLWLDPGRIKRDLQPNKRLGVPLVRGGSYTLIINSGWPDTRGGIIRDDFRKDFFVGERDNIHPDVRGWSLKIPLRNTSEPLVIMFNESLDGMLLKESLQITDASGKNVEGKIKLGEEESYVEFIPELPWRKGSYSLECEGSLEDLAGNNLNRLFDRDITKDSVALSQEVFARKFDIR